jgi:hypothetical protein
MRKTNLLTIVASFAVAGAAMGLLLPGGARVQEVPSQLTLQEVPSQLTLSDGGEHNVHVFPTVNEAAALAELASDQGPLVYHAGGPIMSTATTYAIFWVPPKLQNGGATSMSAHYQSVQRAFLADYPGHGIDNNNTQYYQTAPSTTYIQNSGGLGGFYIDTSAYPTSGCTDSATPGNCITDAQIQEEIQDVMTLKGWTGGLTKMFLLFTSSGEGSCFSSSSSSCAYVQYCAYHGYFLSGTTPVIYGNEPYGNTSVCQVPGTPSPNGDPAADTAATAASHELTEAITDPKLNAWFTASGNEIGDLCAYNYAVNTWDAAKANEMWNGHFYELQQEFDNHKRACVQVGP